VFGTAAYSSYHITGYRRGKKKAKMKLMRLDKISVPHFFSLVHHFVYCYHLVRIPDTIYKSYPYEGEKNDAFGPVQADIMMMYDSGHCMHAVTSPLVIRLSHGIQGSLARLSK
jgi:hypothetical protein